eukprot:scaffold1666_cov112-Isochrysis_galbana.AAC.1
MYASERCASCRAALPTQRRAGSRRCKTRWPCIGWYPTAHKKSTPPATEPTRAWKVGLASETLRQRSSSGLAMARSNETRSVSTATA